MQFQILSTQPDQTASFYGELFGWSISDNNAMGYRRISTGAEEGIQGGIWRLAVKVLMSSAQETACSKLVSENGPMPPGR